MTVAKKVLTFDQIVSAADLKDELMDMPEWGGAIKVRPLTLGQRTRIVEKSTVRNEVDEERLIIWMFIEGVVEPRFSEEHTAMLKEKHYGAVQRVVNRIARISGMSAEVQTATRDTFRS